MPTAPVSVFFASPLEADHIERVRQVSPDLRLLVPSDLWPKLRYVADHAGEPISRTSEQEARWLAMLAQAEICFDFDRWHLTDMARLAPRLRWIQSTSAGIIHYMEQSRLAEAGVVVTTASGVHAVPLAEWAAFAVLWHEKRGAHLSRLRAGKHWERFCGGEALGRTACIVGYGAVGRAVGRHLESLGLNVYGIGSRGLVKSPGAGGAAGSGASPAAHPSPADAVGQALDAILPLADYLVVAVPGTAATQHLIDGRRLALLPPGAFIINVGRGSAIDEAAMIQRLAAGILGGAALDVFEREPLPTDSPFWDMPSVLINPHSASTSHLENGRITDLFCANLRRYLAGQPLVNVYDPARGY